jgi:hypothetical protein
MIALASIALIVIAGSFSFGRAFLGWTRLSSAKEEADQFFIATWIGLLITAGCLMALAQVLSLDRFLLVGLVPIMLFGVIAQRRNLADALAAISFGQNGWRSLIALAISCVGIAIVTSREVVHFDTGFYQLPQVIWLQDHGLVTGLGLLHHRFGYNSIWLALVAPIQDLSHEGRLVAIGSTIACTLLAFHVVHAAGRIVSAVGRPADWFLVAAPLSGAFSAWLVSAMISSSPDVPIWILAILFGWVLLIDRDRQLGPVAVMIAVGAAAIKLSAAPLVIGAAIYVLWTRQLTLRSLLATGLFAALTLGAVMAANVVTSGCLMFPAAATCLPLPWAIPKETAVAVTQFISHWPLFGNINEFNATDIAAYANGTLPVLPMGQRLWLIWSGANPLSWALLAAVIALACASLRDLAGRAGAVALLVAIVGLVFCVSVPAYRFAVGWVGLLAGLAAVAVADWAGCWSIPRLPSNELARVWGRHGMIVGALCVVVLGLAFSSIDRTGDRDLRESGFADRPTGLAKRWLLPPTLVAHQLNPAKGMISGTTIPRSDPTQWVETRVNGVALLRPQSGEQCWGIRRACVPPGEPFRTVALHGAGGRIAFGLASENKVLLATRGGPANFQAP